MTRINDFSLYLVERFIEYNHEMYNMLPFVTVVENHNVGEFIASCYHERIFWLDRREPVPVSSKINNHGYHQTRDR